MRKILLTITILFTILEISQAAVKIDTIYNASGKERKLFYSIPDNYDPSRAYPLIVGLHFCGGTALSYRNSLSPLSDSINAIIVCPDNFSGQVSDSQLDIITAAADSARAAYNIAPDSIYLTGMSCNGETTLRQGLKKFYPFKGIFPWVPYISSKNFSGYDLKSDIPTVIAVGTTDGNLSTLMVLFDSLSANSEDKNLVLVPNVGHVELFPEFASTMIKCIKYINTSKNISIAAINDLIIKNTDSSKEFEVNVEYEGKEELQARVTVSNASRLKATDVNYDVTSKKVKFSLTPVEGKTGNQKVIIEVFEKNGKSISQSVFNIKIENGATSSIKSKNNGECVIYPNPALELINIKSNREIERYDIKDLTGRTLIGGKSNNTNLTIDISSLSKGIYMVISTIGSKYYTEKLLIK